MEKGQYCCLASGCLPGTCHISSYFTQSPYTTGALPAVALVVNPRVGGFAYILSPCGPFKWTLLKIQQFLLPPLSLLMFTVRSYGDLSSWCWNPGLCSLAWGWDHLLLRCPFQFLSSTCERGTAHSTASTSPGYTTSLHLSAYLCDSARLPIWMNTASLTLGYWTST